MVTPIFEPSGTPSAHKQPPHRPNPADERDNGECGGSFELDSHNQTIPFSQYINTSSLEGANFAMDITATIANWQTEVSDLDGRDPSEWDDLDTCLNESQYSYIRLGLLIEKVRNKCYWKYAAGKFGSFKDWCKQRMDLTVWQANAYIESAHIAIYLADAGYVKIPRNFSQAASLIPSYNDEVGYYQDRPVLERVWEQVCQLPKITASAIKSIVNPDYQPLTTRNQIDKILYDRAAKQAKAKGMSVDEYLEDLIGADEYQDVIDNDVVPEVVTEPDPELGRVIDRLERKFQKVNLIDRSTEVFENLMENLIGKYIPKVQLE